MKKILIAVDLSDLAIVALNQASELAVAFGSEARIIHVIAPSPTYIGNEIGPAVVPEDIDENQESIQSDLASMIDYLKQKNIHADSIVCKGPVVDTIIEQAQEFQADMIVMGAHNHGFLYRAFLGSICSGVVKHSPCPVLIIPGK